MGLQGGGLLRTALSDLGLGDETETALRERLDPPVPLDATLSVARFAGEAVAFAASAATRLGIPPTPLDGVRIATSLTSERHFRLNGEAGVAWAPLSGFWQTADGWLRTHANYPHHRAALLQALGVPDADDDATKAGVEAALRSASRLEVEEAIVAAGGVAAAVRTEEEWHAHPHGAGVSGEPLLRVRDRSAGRGTPNGTPERARVGAGSNAVRPLDGIRVLELTRVLAGPIASRTLGLWGADVLRIDPPFLPEPEWIHLDTGPGKRSALLDLHTDRDRFAELLAGADVLVHGYRPGALDALGLTELVDRTPGLIVASLSAWGPGPWAERRGFDSIVQAASGIAVAESQDGVRPGALPAQALDHSAAYLLAGAVAHLLVRRDAVGGSWSVATSLARIGAELLAMPRAELPAGTFEPTVSTSTTALGTVTQALPALGSADYRFPPRPFGADEPTWTVDGKAPD
jgi:crotonobetainyl-CoA:carnitine CoA-transferase CaiB-like acyl-CoA transferase